MQWAEARSFAKASYTAFTAAWAHVQTGHPCKCGVNVYAQADVVTSAWCELPECASAWLAAGNAAGFIPMHTDKLHSHAAVLHSAATQLHTAGL